MEKTVKILIIVCIVLVAGIGVTTGMLLEKNWGSDKQAVVVNNSTSNQSVQNTNNSTNSSVAKKSSNNQSNTKSSGIMTASQAYARMNEMVKEYGDPGEYVKYPTLTNHGTVYQFSHFDQNGNFEGCSLMDAKTGEITYSDWK